MSTLSLRFPSGNAQVGGFDSLAKTLQACSKVAATLEHGQRLQNLSERLFFIQKPANALPSDPDQEAQPHLDFSSTGRPRRTSSIPLSKSLDKRSDLTSSSPRKPQNAVKLSSIFNDDFSPTALLSASNNISNTVEIPLDELLAPDATVVTSPAAAKPSIVQPNLPKRQSSTASVATLKRSSSTTNVQSTPGTSVNAADIAGVNGKAMCANCGATHTPLWRRGLNDELNCNACGLYCKLHKRPRPKVMKISSVASPRPQTYTPPPSESTPVASVSAVCHNCKTTTTPLWRKNDAGQNVCNACGLYHKLHGEARPVSMKSDVVRKRSRQETTARSSNKSMPLPTQREFPKAAAAGLKVNTTPVSYERSSSLSAGATPRKGSFASDDDDEDLERKEREAAAVGLKLSEIQLLQSTLHELQRRGDESGRHSSRNSEYGDMTDGEGYGSDEPHSRKRRREEDEGYEPYDRRPSYDARARARLGSDYGRPSPLRQMVDGAGEPSHGQQGPVYTQQRAQSPFSASSSESSSPRTVERDLPMSHPYSPSQPAVAVDGYYAHGYYPKDVNPAYMRVPSSYDYDYRGGVPRKYRRQPIEMV